LLKGIGFFVFTLTSIIFYWTFLALPWVVLLALSFTPKWLRVFANSALGWIAGYWYKSVLGYIEFILGTSIVLYAAEPKQSDDVGSHTPSHGVGTPSSVGSSSTPSSTPSAFNGYSNSYTPVSMSAFKALLPQPHERAIIISNHPTRLDWIYLGAILGGPTFRVVLKQALAYYPFAGWTIQALTYLFLSREWAKDQMHLEDICEYWSKYLRTPHVLIFPEGSNLTKDNLVISHAYSAKENLPKWSQVLMPRITGFAALLKKLNQAPSTGPNTASAASADAVNVPAHEDSARNVLVRDPQSGEDLGSDDLSANSAPASASGQKPVVDVICDFTLAYSPYIIEGEAELLRGEFPTHVHILCDRYPVSELPLNNEAELKQWLYDRFAAKEQLLSLFYSSQTASYEDNRRTPRLHPNENAAASTPIGSDNAPDSDVYTSVGPNGGQNNSPSLSSLAAPSSSSHHRVELVRTPPLATPFTPGIKGHVVSRDPKDVAESAIAFGVTLICIVASAQLVLGSWLSFASFLMVQTIAVYLFTTKKYRIDRYLVQLSRSSSSASSTTAASAARKQS